MDGVPDSVPAKITVTVGGGNAEPVAVDDHASVDEGLAPTATPIDVLANDTDADEDALTIDEVTLPEHGTAVVSDGRIAYHAGPALRGHGRHATQRGASATITVTGKSFAWIAPTNGVSGRAEVLVDGVKVATVSLWSSTSYEGRVIFASTFATAGTHAATIRNLATSGHPRMSLDALFVLTR